MASSQTVMMEYPDESGKYTGNTANFVPVKTENVAREVKFGGRIVRKSMPTAQRVAADVADWAPQALGLAGGVVGGVFGAPVGEIPAIAAGTGVGQAAGQLIKEGVYRASGLGDAPGTVAGEFGYGALSGAAGGVLGKGAGALGKAAMNTALGKSALKTAETVGTALSERIPVGKLGDLGNTIYKKIPGLSKFVEGTGSDKLAPIVEAAKAARDRVLSRLEQRGFATTHKEFMSEAEAYIAKLRGARMHNEAASAKAALDNMRKVLVGVTKSGKEIFVRRQAGDPVLVKEAQNIVVGANNALDNYYSAHALGRKAPLTPELEIVKRAGDTFRNWLRDISEQEVMQANRGVLKIEQTLGHLNERYGKLINLQRVLQEAEKKEGLGRVAETAFGGAASGMGAMAIPAYLSGQGSLAALGAGVGGAVGAFPVMASRLGLGLTSPLTQAALRYGLPQAGQQLVNPSRRVTEESTAPQYAYPSDSTATR